MASSVAQLRPDIDPLAALDPVLLHTLTAHAHGVVSIVDRRGRVLFSGGAIHRIFGYEPGERLGHSVVDIVHPEDLDHASMRLQRLLSDPDRAGDDAVAARIRNKAGDYLNCEITGMPLRHAGRTALVVLHTRDVTAQARALARSAVAEVRLETAIQNADIGLWEFDSVTGILTRTEDWFERHDLPRLVDGRPGPHWYDRIHPDDIERVRRIAAGRLQRSDDRSRLQYRIRSRSGRWVWLSEEASIISRNPDGSPRVLAGVCICLDEIKQLEAELEVMQERLRLAVEASGMALWDWRVAELADGAGAEAPPSGLAALQQTMLEYVPACLVLLDAERRIRFANRSLTQHLPDAAVGREFDECFMPPWRPVVAAAIKRSRDELRNVEVEGIAPAAARLAGRSYRLHVAPVSARGAFEGWCVVVRDVTHARNAETDAFNAICRDSQRIGHELHDGVGQQLTGAVLLMQSLVSGLAAERHRLAPEAEQVQGLVNQSIDDVRMLARSLSPVGTAPTGLPAAIQSLAARARSPGRLTVDLNVAVEPGHTLTAVEGDHLFWIAQEAVTNAIRHATATHLELGLEVSGDRFWLRVRDDGRGVAPALDPLAGSGSGVKLMAHRARGLGATFTMTPDVPRGTLVTCVRAGRR